MSDLRVTLLSDGPSDLVLLRHIQWLLSRHLSSLTVQSAWADLRRLRHKPKSLAERISRALDLYPCDLLLVHRDAEKEDPSLRLDEIEKAVSESGVDVPVIPVIPVRMTEAWLLFDEAAIRRAAGNPNGHALLNLPASQFDELADPKSVLRQALQSASGLSGRRLRKFGIAKAVYRVGEHIDDFAPLRTLPAFQELEVRLVTVLKERGWI